jgi:hypothetical protein
MPQFTVRVVLHGADSKDYEKLHVTMAKNHSAKRQISANDVAYDLPDGEYDITSSFSAADLCGAVHATAVTIKAKPSPSVLVTELGRRAWVLRKVPGDS